MPSRFALRRYRPIEYVASRRSATARISRILVNRSNPYSAVTKNNLFRAIAVVRIEVPDPNTFAACFQCITGSNRNRVHIAKAHRSSRSRVMTGRTHQREAFSTAESQIHRTDGRSGG